MLIPSRIPLKAIAEHRKFFSVLRKAKGPKKLLAYGFLALTVFNLIYALTSPAQAFLFDDLTGVGRAAGQSITDSAYQIIVDIYSGKYGILDWLSKTCLIFATPIATIGIIQTLDDRESQHKLSKGVLYSVLALVICLSGGGYVGGHLYLFLYEIFEGFVKGMDDRMSIHAAIESGKGFLSSNAMLSASFAECHKFVGQEQVACISKASTTAMETMGDMAKTYNSADWIKGRVLALSAIAKDITSSDNILSAAAAQSFFIFVQPVAETAAAAHATASIVTMSISYTMTMAFIGLGGPVALLASLLAPGLQGAWAIWLIGVFSVWFWHTSYLALMWFLSKLLLTATPSTFVAVDWFTFAAQWVAPTITGAIAGVGGMATFQGITRSVNDATEMAANVAMMAAKAAVGAAVGGPAGAMTAINMGGGGGNSAPPQNMPSAPVATKY